MSFLVKALTQCFTRRSRRNNVIALPEDDEKTHLLYAEPKELYYPPATISYEVPSTLKNDILLADTVISIILGSEKGGHDLLEKLAFIEGGLGWSQEVAICMVANLEVELMETAKLTPVMRDCRNRVWEAAMEIDGFNMNEPGYRGLVAVGMLVIAAPSIAEALGFAEFGYVSGSYAEAWHARYDLPVKSVFGFFVRASLGWDDEYIPMAMGPHGYPVPIVYGPLEQWDLGPYPPLLPSVF